jgi:hypothetical protein
MCARAGFAKLLATWCRQIDNHVNVGYFQLMPPR